MFISRCWCLLISSVFLVVVVVLFFVFCWFFLFCFFMLSSYLFSFLEREASRDKIVPTSTDNSASSGDKKRAPFKRLDRRE